MHRIAELAELIRREKPDGVIGITREQISEIQDAWGIAQLPSAYVEVLTHMGARAGRVLRGADAFYPVLLQMKAWAGEFWHEVAPGLGPGVAGSGSEISALDMARGVGGLRYGG